MKLVGTKEERMYDYKDKAAFLRHKERMESNGWRAKENYQNDHLKANTGGKRSFTAFFTRETGLFG